MVLNATNRKKEQCDVIACDWSMIYNQTFAFKTLIIRINKVSNVVNNLLGNVVRTGSLGITRSKLYWEFKRLTGQYY